MEERNYAAIFFAALCNPENAERFVDYCGFKKKVGADFGIYFECVYLRDLWKQIPKEATKKEIIRQLLPISGIDEIMGLPIVEINRKFGVAGQPSEKFVQNPGKWAITKYNEKFQDNSDFLKICKFKWSFNIKPDIVIHLDKNRAICIEAKYHSGEGSYPSSNVEKNIFNKRGLDYLGQINLQRYMMEELLGVKTDFVYLVYNEEKSETHTVVSWKKAFGCLDLSEMPLFALEMVNNISGSKPQDNFN
jgi:hypothetical protein